jgi:AcrR family transcriptional regulator
VGGWSEHAAWIDDRGAHVTAALLAATRPQPGECVLELACGPGGVGLAAALLVGAAGPPPESLRSQPDAVNPKRSYDSPRRREQAAATRREMLTAAQRLFEAHGFTATTIAAIAEEAGVATKTVYSAFETKGGVLRALWNLLLRGDADDVPVLNRAWYREVLDEPDAARQLQLNARNGRAVKERIAAVLDVIRHAAELDDETAALWGRIQSDFYDNQRAVVRSLDEKGALREGLDVVRASDLLWTLNHLDVWQLLVAQRGWKPEQYERWFAATAREQLLGPATAS